MSVDAGLHGEPLFDVAFFAVVLIAVAVVLDMSEHQLRDFFNRDAGKIRFLPFGTPSSV